MLFVSDSTQAQSFLRDTAFIIKERDLIPESIAYDCRTKQFFIGSLYKSKILSLNQAGTSHFSDTADNRIKSITGIKIDNRNHVLWALGSSAKFLYTNKGKDTLLQTALLKFDLETGQLLSKCNTKDLAIFNDLVIDQDSNIFITDSYTGSVYTFHVKENKLFPFLPYGSFAFPNGISIAGKNLFVAHANGISLIDIRTRKITELKFASGIDPGGIDGLYFYRNSLIAIQNGTSPRRVTRFQLTKDHKMVTDWEMLESSELPRNLWSPTTGVLVDDVLYFIANAQVKSFDKDGRIFANDKLSDIIIKKISMKY